MRRRSCPSTAAAGPGTRIERSLIEEQGTRIARCRSAAWPVALPANPARVLKLAAVIRISLCCDSAEQRTVHSRVWIRRDERVRSIIRFEPQLERDPFGDP